MNQRCRQRPQNVSESQHTIRKIDGWLHGGCDSLTRLFWSAIKAQADEVVVTAEVVWEDRSKLKVELIIQGDRIKVSKCSLNGDKSAAKDTRMDQHRLHKAKICLSEYLQLPSESFKNNLRKVPEIVCAV
jgi:hypothetical protein